MGKIFKWIGIVFAVIIVLSLIISLFSDDKPKAKSEETKTKEETPLPGSTAYNNQEKGRLENELKSFEKPFVDSAYQGSAISLAIEGAIFTDWANLIKKADSTNDEAIKKLALTLKGKVSDLQVKQFPKMRREYADIMAKKVWENDVYVSIEDPHSTVLNITGSVFATNKNISDIQQKISDDINWLRFKDVRYRWYKGEDEYTHYDIKSLSDADVVAIF